MSGYSICIYCLQEGSKQFHQMILIHFNVGLSGRFRTKNYSKRFKINRDI